MIGFMWATAMLCLMLAIVALAAYRPRAQLRRRRVTRPLPDYAAERRAQKKAEHDDWYAQWKALIPRKPEPPALVWWDGCECDSVYEARLCDRWGANTITRINPDCKDHGKGSWHEKRLVKYEADKRAWVQMNLPSLAQNPYQYPRRTAGKVNA